jgi:hypothetical protein
VPCRIIEPSAIYFEPAEGAAVRPVLGLLGVDQPRDASYLARMTPAEGKPDGHSADACAELRATVETRCAQAHEAKQAFEDGADHIRELKRDLIAAQHKHAETIEAANPQLRAAEKSAARDTYKLAQAMAADDEAAREATAEWARAVDHINRSSRRAYRAVTAAKATVDGLETALREAERGAQLSHVQSEQAEAACLDARVRLAACEEQAAAPETAESASGFDPHAATAGHAVAVSDTGEGQPLVIESMVSGDRKALELAAERIAEHTGFSPAEAQLQLQELVDAIVSAASEDGHLVFDRRHPFWSELSFEEARDVIAALARLGFIFEPSEGWHAGRAPAPSDLSMALAYAGLDPRNMRDLPNADDLRQLPASIGVDARAFLAAQAPELAVDHIVNLLGRRAAQLEPLWNEWGQVRPILLSDRHSLGSLEG